MTATENSNEAQIRERLESWANAVRAKDIEAVMSHYAPDILLFDLAPPLQYSGADACQKNWASWFPTFQGRVGYEITELSIVASHDMAYSHSLNRICRNEDGRRTNRRVGASDRRLSQHHRQVDDLARALFGAFLHGAALQGIARSQTRGHLRLS